MDSEIVRPSPEARDRGAAVKGPLPVPVVVPLAKAVPVDVDATRKLNWSVGSTRAPTIDLRKRIEAKRTANIAPCKPPACMLAVTVVGLVDPTI